MHLCIQPVAEAIHSESTSACDREPEINENLRPLAIITVGLTAARRGVVLHQQPFTSAVDCLLTLSPSRVSSGEVCRVGAAFYDPPSVCICVCDCTVRR